jgi:GDP-L-fucose synthase
VPALVKKVSNVNTGGTIELWGDGTAMRQQLYVDDLVQIIPVLLENHNTDEPIIVSPNENLTIDEMARCLIGQTGKDIRIVYNNRLPGQHRKDGSNKEFLKKIDNFKFTPFNEGVKKTYEWYNKK